MKKLLDKESVCTGLQLMEVSQDPTSMYHAENNPHRKLPPMGAAACLSAIAYPMDDDMGRDCADMDH